MTHFSLSHDGMQCCESRSGSGRIRIIVPDPDCDRHPGHIRIRLIRNGTTSF
jgi:hypothetical protein